jgi:hypothetical protein
MTPPAATAAARSHARPKPRTAAPRTARRVSGPTRSALVAGSGGTVLAPPLGIRLADRARTLPDARLLDRLVRGRLWIAVLAAMLVGIVFLQISLLKLNTGISRAVQTEQTLERQNTRLKTDLSALAGGERVQDSAAAMGFVTPATGQPRFLDAGRASAERAARGITRPAPVQQLPLGMIPPAQGGTAGVTPDPAAVAPATAAPVGTAAAAPAATAAAPAATTAAPAATTAAPTPAPAPATATPAAVAPAPAAAAPVTPSPPTAQAGGAAAAPQG